MPARRSFLAVAPLGACALLGPGLAACDTAQEPTAAQRVQGGARPTSIAPNTSGGASPPATTPNRGTPVSGSSSNSTSGGTNPGAQGAPGPQGSQGEQGGAEPEHIQVQHVLVGFRGSVPGKPITRTQEEARTLAYEILEKAKGGADFDALVRQYTDDSPPGIYGMANRGVRPNQGDFQREGMVAAFGNVGFKLPVGGYGVADFDQRTSPYGYHVIKRLR